MTLSDGLVCWRTVPAKKSNGKPTRRPHRNPPACRRSPLAGLRDQIVSPVLRAGLRKPVEVDVTKWPQRPRERVPPQVGDATAKASAPTSDGFGAMGVQPRKGRANGHWDLGRRTHQMQ